MAYVSDESITSVTPHKLSDVPLPVWLSKAMPASDSNMATTVAAVTFSWKRVAIMTATITG